MTTRMIIVLIVTSGACALACLWLYQNCCERIRRINARLENIKHHIDAMQEAQVMDWESCGRLEERVEILERRGEDDGK